MKIVGVDNYARESVADDLICENVTNTYIGGVIVDALNKWSGEDGDRLYKLVANDYRLWGGMDEFI